MGACRHAASNWLSLHEEALYGEEDTGKIQEVEDPGPEPGQQSIPSGVMESLKKRLSEPEGPKQL